MNKEYIYAWVRYLALKVWRTFIHAAETIGMLILLIVMSALIVLSLTLDFLDGGYREGKLI